MQATTDGTQCYLEAFSFPEAIVIDAGSGNDTIKLEYQVSGSTEADCDDDIWMEMPHGFYEPWPAK